MRDATFHILFVWYPYVCLSAFIFGSLIRFDREQYTWRASSSQLLRRKQLTWGSNLFHVGILASLHDKRAVRAEDAATYPPLAICSDQFPVRSSIIKPGKTARVESSGPVPRASG